MFGWTVGKKHLKKNKSVSATASELGMRWSCGVEIQVQTFQCSGQVQIDVYGEWARLTVWKANKENESCTWTKRATTFNCHSYSVWTRKMSTILHSVSLVHTEWKAVGLCQIPVRCMGTKGPAHGAGELPEQVFHLWRPAALQRGDQSKHKNVSNICFSVQITADTILLKWKRMRPTTQHVIRKYFLSLMFYWNIMGTRKHVQLTQ